MTITVTLMLGETTWFYEHTLLSDEYHLND